MWVLGLRTSDILQEYRLIEMGSLLVNGTTFELKGLFNLLRMVHLQCLPCTKRLTDANVVLSSSPHRRDAQLAVCNYSTATLTQQASPDALQLWRQMRIR